METVLDIFVLTVFMALLATQVQFSKATCVELELAGEGFKDNETEVNEDGYVHISFVLRDICQSSADNVRVKVSTMSRDILTTFCTIVFQENACKITDQSLTCHCINKGLMFASISKKISLADKVVIEWKGNRTSREEKSVFLFVNGSRPTIKTDEKIVTPVAIGICCCILVAVVFAVVAIKRRDGSRTKKQQGRLSKDRQMTLGNHPSDVTPTSPANLTNTPTQTGTRRTSVRRQQSQGRTRTRGVARLQGHRVTRTRIGILTYSGQPKPNNNGMTATQNQSSQEPIYDRAITFSPIEHKSQEQLNDHLTKTEEQQYDRAITFSQTVTMSQEQTNDQTLTQCQNITTSPEGVYDRAVTFSQTVTRSQEETNKHVVIYQKPEKSLIACHNIQPNSNQKPTASPRLFASSPIAAKNKEQMTIKK